MGGWVGDSGPPSFAMAAFFAIGAGMANGVADDASGCSNPRSIFSINSAGCLAGARDVAPARSVDEASIAGMAPPRPDPKTAPR